jgi:hypothetical protein
MTHLMSGLDSGRPIVVATPAERWASQFWTSWGREGDRVESQGVRRVPEPSIEARERDHPLRGRHRERRRQVDRIRGSERMVSGDRDSLTCDLVDELDHGDVLPRLVERRHLVGNILVRGAPLPHHASEGGSALDVGQPRGRSGPGGVDGGGDVVRTGLVQERLDQRARVEIEGQPRSSLM